MKKLLIFMLVLGMASSASAVLNPSWSTTVNGTPWTGGAVVLFAPGDVIVVTLHEGSYVPAGGCTSLGINVDHGDYIAGSLAPPPENEPYLAWTILAEGVVSGDGFNNIVSLTLPLGGMTDFDVFHFGFVPTDLAVWTDITISCYQGAYFGASGPATIPNLTLMIPEPMTIALLGLGGLFLLRRRK